MTPSQQAERWAAILLRIRSVIRRFWWIPLLTISLGLGVGGILAFREETWFRSTAKLMVSGRIQVNEGNAFTEEGANFIGTQIELMKSAKVLDAAAARVRADGKTAPSAVSDLQISVLPNTSIFILRATARTPEYSLAFLDAIIAEYIALKRGIRTEKSDSAISALADEMVRLDKERQTAEDESEQFLKEHSLVILKEGENTAAKYLADLNQRLADLKTQAALFDHLELDELRGLKASAAKGPDNPGDGKEADFIVQADYLKAQQELQLLKQKREELAKNLRDDHPDIVALDAQISEQNRNLQVHKEVARKELEVRRQSLASQIKAIEEEVESWKTKALDIGRLMGEYGRIQSKVERSKTAYDRILQSIGAVDLTKNLQQDVVSVLEKPSAPESVRPGMGRTLATSAMVGFIIGACILFLLDRSSTQIASPEEFVADFDERLIGIVPKEREAGDRLQMADERHAFSEAFFNLRSSLLFLEYQGPMPKIFLITSSIPNEGKSTLAGNVALAFAFAGSKTLLIDGDLRRGAVHDRFKVPNDKGFAEFLQGQVKNWRDVVFPSDTPNLFVMPRGGHIYQPSKYFVNSSTDQFLREIYKDFDQVIIDSCPVLAADDTTSLAPKVDAVLVIARMGVVSRRHVMTTLTSLRARQANVLGFILNGVDERMTGYSYYSYTEYYNKDNKGERTKAGAAK